MKLSYKNKDTYQIICDEKGYSGACYIVTNTDIYNDKVFLVSTSSQQQIPLEKMKDIVQNLKGG